ncbi:hypothetical protein DFH06DRAFT_1256690, partial [Mycena polygramma]
MASAISAMDFLNLRRAISVSLWLLSDIADSISSPPLLRFNLRIGLNAEDGIVCAHVSTDCALVSELSLPLSTTTRAKKRETYTC